MHKPVVNYKAKFYGKHIHIPLNYDRFYYKAYKFSAGVDGYTIYYSHYKYRDDYVCVTLQHKVIEEKTCKQIYEDAVIILDSIGINTSLLELDDRLNRIDLKWDYKARNILEINAFFNAISKSRDSFNSIDKINYTTAIKYKPVGSSTEIIIYDKWAEMNARKKKRSHVDLDISIYENVIRTEIRLKSKRLYNNSQGKMGLRKNLSEYFNEKVIDECFKKYVEPIFYSEPFFRIDYAIIAITHNDSLTEIEKEKLCYLVTEINKKGYSEAKRTYKYCDDTFDKHINLLRKIGINPLTFNKNFDIGIIPNFTKKEPIEYLENEEKYILEEVGDIF